MNRIHSAAQRGVSLIESTVVLAIVSTVVGTIAPSFTSLRDRHHLEGAAGQLESELQWARSAAVARNEPVRFSFEAQGRGSCYVIHTGGPRDCQCAASEVPVCAAGVQVLRSWRDAGDARVTVQSNSSSFAFNPRLGTVTPTATLELRNRQSDTIRLVVNIMGRVRACTPNGKLPGYAVC